MAIGERDLKTAPASVSSTGLGLVKGLGVTLNHDVLAANPRRQIFFNLFAENWHRRQAERA